nr:hypothetical protein BSM_23210 [uncultured archaeon]
MDASIIIGAIVGIIGIIVAFNYGRKSVRPHKELETWLLVDIYLKKRKNFKDVILKALEPAINLLETKNLLETFHFFTEPQISDEDLRISLRIRIKNKKQKEQVKDVLKQKLKSVQNFLIKETDFDRENYVGEQNSFGEKGWLIVQKLFEFGSRAAIFNLKGDAMNPPYGGKDFRPEKFVHCFLNQIGYTDVFCKPTNNQIICFETFFHFDRYFERMAKRERKTLEQAKDIIKKLLEQENGINYFNNY